MVKKYAEGGSVDPSNKPEMRERLKQAEIDSKKIMRDAQDGYKKGGAVKKYADGGKVKKPVPSEPFETVDPRRQEEGQEGHQSLSWPV
jgi:hypothetical protein